MMTPVVTPTADETSDAATPTPRISGRALRPTLPDVLLPVGLTLWAIGVATVRTGPLHQYGTLSALPWTFYTGLAVVLVSTGVLIAQDRPSAPRLVLHLAALILMIHGTAPLVYPEPRYAWTYKHVGVVNAISTDGRLNAGVDIYNNWPGFFAAAAWFGKVAGVADPIAYAAWAQVFFNALVCLELGFALRALPLTNRERWLTLFLFVAGNWVAQDYFAPQAMGYVISLGVFGIALHWFRADRPPAWIGRILSRGRTLLTRGSGATVEEAPPRIPVGRVGATVALLGVYFVLVFTHELSPYVVAIQVTALVLIGALRPRWIALAMWAICIAYLIPRFAIINEAHHILSSLANPFSNLLHSSKQFPPGLPAHRVAANAARTLSLFLWAVGLLGAWWRLRRGKEVLPLVVLAFSPFVVVLAQSYGGEAIYRAYLFSLPWTACLVASLLMDLARSFAARWVFAALGLVVTAGLLLPPYFGMDLEYVMPPAEVEASAYFYEHAQPGAVLLSSLNFPTRLAANYDRFVVNPNGTDPNFLDSRLWGQVLGVQVLPILADKVEAYERAGATSGYVVLSTSQDHAATLLGILPEGSLTSLEQALLASRDWSVFYRNSDTIIFRYTPTSNPRTGSASRTEATDDA